LRHRFERTGQSPTVYFLTYFLGSGAAATFSVVTGKKKLWPEGKFESRGKLF
jgi:hypothetical protein